MMNNLRLKFTMKEKTYFIKGPWKQIFSNGYASTNI